MKMVVFLGPSLPVEEARAILDAIYLPPAAQADLISAVTTYHPGAIGLIDGMFLQHLSVWHKEILYALERGVRVYGASSIGALRAAETAAFGMVGVGEVYRMFASGELSDDDEVALAHGHAADGWRKLSEPMVNLRATFRAARQAGLLDDDQLARLEAAAKSIYFPERSFPAIFRKAAATGVPAPTIAALEWFVRTSYVDVKRADAVRLLETLRDLPEDATPPRPRFSLVTTRLSEALYERDRTVRHGDVDVPLVALAHQAALHRADFPGHNFHALNRTLVLVLAELLDFQPSPEEVEREGQRFRAQRRLDDEAALDAWLARHHLQPDEWLTLMREMATCRSLQRSLLVGRTVKGSTRLLLDELRLSGGYEEVLEQAALTERILRAHPPFEGDGGGGDAAVPLAELMTEHLEETDCRMDTDPVSWCEEAGFDGLDELRQALLDARRVRRILQRLMARLSLLAEDDKAAAGGGDPDPVTRRDDEG